MYFLLEFLAFFSVKAVIIKLFTKMQDTKSGKCKEDENIERQRRGSNSGKRQGVPAALRLMSPCDSDQELNDLEVASVLEGKIIERKLM